MITASKMDAANVEAVLKRDVELVAANETLSRLVDWDGPGAVENARELYEAVAAQAEEHASAERGLRAELEARGACLQAEMVKLSQAQTSLDYAGVRRADLERELETAHSDMDSMKAQLYTLRGLQKAWQEQEKTLRAMLGVRATDFREAVVIVEGVIAGLDACRLLLERIVHDPPVLADAEVRAIAGHTIRKVIDPALEGFPDAPRSEPG